MGDEYADAMLENALYYLTHAPSGSKVKVSVDHPDGTHGCWMWTSDGHLTSDDVKAMVCDE